MNWQCECIIDSGILENFLSQKNKKIFFYDCGTWYMHVICLVVSILYTAIVAQKWVVSCWTLQDVFTDLTHGNNDEVWRRSVLACLENICAEKLCSSKWYNMKTFKWYMCADVYASPNLGPETWILLNDATVNFSNIQIF